MNKTNKQLFVDNLTSELKSAKAAIVVNYAGLTVEKQEELKSRLRTVDARFLVVKNTLLKIAAINTKAPKEITEDTVLSGQNAIVLADDDPIRPILEIAKFAKENELPQIKVGLVEGYFQDENALLALSKLGSKDAVVSQVVGIMAAPTYHLVGVLQAKLQEFTYILQSIADNK
jgi:large subunit ribosomal protein L10